MVQIKRAYAAACPGDGYRVLVDRFWPRGVTKARAAVDLWAKEVAPSASLRTWFGHEPGRFREFALRYRRELRTADARETLRNLAGRAGRGPVTLVYGARDETHNGAVVLLAMLRTRAARARRAALPGPREIPGARRSRGQPGRRPAGLEE